MGLVFKTKAKDAIVQGPLKQIDGMKQSVDFPKGPTVPLHFQSNEDIITKFELHGLWMVISTIPSPKTW